MNTKPRLAARMGLGSTDADGQPERSDPITDAEATEDLREEMPTSEEIEANPEQALEELATIPHSDARTFPDPEKGPHLDTQTVMSAENEAYSSITADLAADVGQVDLTQEVKTLRGALAWAMDLISHPAKQMTHCPTHGKVPLTHMCSVFRDDEYANVLKAMADPDSVKVPGEN